MVLPVLLIIVSAGLFLQFTGKDYTMIVISYFIFILATILVVLLGIYTVMRKDDKMSDFSMIIYKKINKFLKKLEETVFL